MKSLDMQRHDGGVEVGELEHPTSMCFYFMPLGSGIRNACKIYHALAFCMLHA